MKKLIISLIFVLLAIPLISACSCNPTPPGYYVVRYVIDGKELYSAYAERDEIIGMPVLEEREGCVFKGWYITDEYIEKWDFEHDTVKGYLTLYGYWVAESEETFNVLYYSDSKLINYEKVPKGNNASEYLLPDKEGYEFQGWTNNGSKFEFNSPIIYDVNLYAEWKAITYTVTFVADNEIVSVINYTIEDKNLKIPDVPLKEHYTGEWPSFNLDLENIEVSAVYTPVVYTATFIADDKTISKFQYTVEDTVYYPSVPVKTGYKGEWVGLPVAGGNVTVTAEYTPIVYTITYKAKEIIVETVLYTVENVNEIIPPDVPQIAGYSGKWEETDFKFGDVTINAIYTIQVYTATFIVDDKTVGTSKFQIDNMYIEEPEIPNKKGYTAVWEDYTLVYGDLKIKAVYTPITYTADFYIGSEKVKSENFTVEDKEINLPEVKEWQGYSVEWKSVTITPSNLTLYAKLTPIIYYVTFVADEIEVAKIEYTVENKNITLPLLPQKPAYTAKWEDFTLTYGDVTVKALYTPISDEELNFKDEFDYQTESDGSLTITGYHGDKKYLYVPASHNGSAIKAIGKLAFSGSDIVGIKLNNDIEVISDEAFLNCRSLTEVLLPDTIKKIGKNAFAFCGFTEINLPDGISEIGEQAFAYSSLTSIILPKNLLELKNIFFNCSDLESIVFNENLFALRTGTFKGCSSLKSITIPNNIKLIEANAFAETAIESVTFDNIDNWTIYSASGIEIQNIDYSQLSDEATAAEWLTRVYISRYWKNSKE